MPDILVLGATGYTGRLVTRYLHAHPERASFTFAVGARSKFKLAQLVSELRLDESVEVIQVDVTRPEEVDAVVQRAKVVLNAVGPYWRWGTPVVGACARHGVHHLDLNGETAWVQDIITRFDYLAYKTGAIIVPSCGLDSVPSDICAFLSAKTLKAALGPDTALGESRTSVRLRGGISGGTFQTVISVLEEIPNDKLAASRRPYALSPVQGRPAPRPRLLYTLPPPARGTYGALNPLAPHNTAIVQRTWGLLQAHGPPGAAYGPQFTYEECLEMPGAVSAMLFSLGVVGGLLSLTLLAPVRWLFKLVVAKAGTGPSDEALQRGTLRFTNVTASTPTPTRPTAHAQTVMHGTGDPGYLLTALMFAEAGLALLDPARLPALARHGGVLTPMSALGDVLIERLRATQRFEFESAVVGPEGAESRKTR